MAARRSADPAKTRAAVAAVAQWLRDDSATPDRVRIAEAVRTTARTLAAVAPGIVGGSAHPAVRRRPVHRRAPHTPAAIRRM